jgi:hypothetical protein
MNKAELIDTLKTERNNWDAVLAQVGEERMTEPGVVGDWSVKDVLSHLTAWESRPLEWLEAARRGDTPRPADWPQGLSEDEENAWIYQRSASRPLQDVLQESRAVSNRIMELLNELPEEDLSDPQHYAWTQGTSLIDRMPGNTFDHYREHAQQIREWLKRREGGGENEQA